MQVQANCENQLLTPAGNIPHPHTRSFISYWAGDASLCKAYKEAEKITAEHSKSFYFASGFLPEEKRSAVRALYAFCRTVDDIVDVSTDAERESQLDYWRGMIEHGSFLQDDLVAAAWAETLTRYHIPRHYALQLIDGVYCDLTQSRYQTFEELATYCYGVASTVGLMGMYIIGFKNNEAVPYAIKLGVALQMTNILRDISEDYRIGRLYLPEGGYDVPLRGATALIIFHSDRSSGFAEANCNLALQTASLMVEALKLGAFYTGHLLSSCWRDRVIPDLLVIPEKNRIHAGLPIGYPRFKYVNWVERKPARVTWF